VQSRILEAKEILQDVYRELIRLNGSGNNIFQRKKDMNLNTTVSFQGNSISNGQPLIVDKVWGREVIYSRGPFYALKVMHISPGHQVSMHMHHRKIESFLVTQGTLLIETINLSSGEKTSHTLKPYDVITLEQQTLHTFYCPDNQLCDTIFIEASTQDSPDDNYRVSQSR
jgi:mannose-6-phosphate isomerase-like protein (cupin superfamily)